MVPHNYGDLAIRQPSWSPVHHGRAIRGCREASRDLLGHAQGRQSVGSLALQPHVAVGCQEDSLDGLHPPLWETQSNCRDRKAKSAHPATHRCEVIDLCIDYYSVFQGGILHFVSKGSRKEVRRGEDSAGTTFLDYVRAHAQRRGRSAGARESVVCVSLSIMPAYCGCAATESELLLCWLKVSHPARATLARSFNPSGEQGSAATSVRALAIVSRSPPLRNPLQIMAAFLGTDGSAMWWFNTIAQQLQDGSTRHEDSPKKDGSLYPTARTHALSVLGTLCCVWGGVYGSSRDC